MSENKRSTWGSNATFIMAAIGSAVGLGNVWRFPGLAARHGGGAFLLVYVIAILTLGIPLLMMEIAIGRKMRSGAPGAMRGINKKFEFIGWASVSNSFVISIYYSVVFAWVILMAFFSFKFAGFTEIKGISEAGIPLSNEAASGLWANLIKTTGNLTGFSTISVWVLLCLIIGWVLIYLCIRNGTKTVDKVIGFILPLPMICLIIMAVKGLTMPGAFAGLAAFFTPDFSALSNPQLWTDAFGQVFYSMSVMMAIMFAYGSFLNDDNNIAKSGIIIAIADFAVSVIAGVVMFTTMYGTLGAEKAALELSTKGGISTAFVVYPTAIVNLSSSGLFNAVFGFIFYFCLCSLAIDSAFSIIQGIATAVSDKFGIDLKKVTFYVCLVSGGISLFFVTGAGLAWVDIVDNWCNNYSLIFVGVLETIAIGWLFKPKKVLGEINRNTGSFRMPSVWFNASLKFIAPVALTAILVFNVITLVKDGGIYGAKDGYNLLSNILLGWLIFVLVLASGFIINFIKTKNKDSHSVEWLD